MSSKGDQDSRNRDKVLDVYKPTVKLDVQPRLLKQLRECDPDSIPKKYYFTNYPGIIGVEVEVEGYPDSFSRKDSLWKTVKDHSLKYYGTEFVSVPMQGRVIDHGLQKLEYWLSKKTGSIKMSHRCSVHIHINVSNLPMYKLQELMALYIKLEPYFYKQVDSLRYNSPFCIPNSEVGLLASNMVHNKYIINHSKYLALAFNRLHDYGTVELRSLQGTTDIVKIRRWIMQLQKLFLYVSKNDVYDDIMENDDSVALAEKVFNTLFSVLNKPKQSQLEYTNLAAINFIIG